MSVLIRNKSRYRFLPLLIILVLSLAAAFLCSCENTSGDTGGELSETVSLETLPEITVENTVKIVFDGETDYKLLKPYGASGYSSAVNDLCDSISKYMLIQKMNHIYVEPDEITEKRPVTECEILVGSTNRPESEQALEGLGKDDFTVKLIGKKLVINGTSDAAIKEAVIWFNETYVENRDSLVLESDFCYIKSEAPYIIDMSQENLYWDFSTDSPEITLTVISPDMSEPELTGFSVDGKDVMPLVKYDGCSITMGGISFDSGMHYATVSMKSASGYIGCEVFAFGCGECDDMQLYKGEIHSHTSDSDGIGTPEEAYNYARYTAGLDFFAVTDHSSSSRESVYVNQQIPTANRLNEPGKFVTLYGYEHGYTNSTGYCGHLNTINTAVYTYANATPLEAYYKKMAKASNAIVQFNHPGYSWGNFLEYGFYKESYDRVVNLFEFKGASYDNEWALCLAKGWHVSPMHNEDNHQGQWGTVNEAVGYVLAPSLTRANITEAMTLNRTYTTTDKTMKIYYSVNGEWLGSRLQSPESLNVKVKITTSKAAGLGTVQLVAEDNIVVEQKNVGTKGELDWEFTVTPEYDYYYIKVNGGAGFAVTAPVWVEGRDKLNITGMDRGVISYENDSKSDQRIYVDFKNDAAVAMSDVTVTFYQSALSGFVLGQHQPVEKRVIGTLEAGASAEAFADVPYVLSSNRITAVVTGKIGGKTYTDTCYIQINSLMFTEICTSSEGWSFIEIYNATDDTVNLSGYKVRLWPATGAKSDALNANTLELSGTLEPQGVMTVWLKTDEKLTVADFNTHFGTSLTEGKDLLVLSSSWYIPVKRGVQLDLMNANTVINRAQYNYGTDSVDAEENKSILFTYKKAYTLTTEKYRTKQTPTPGTFDASVLPRLVTVPDAQ